MEQSEKVLHVAPPKTARGERTLLMPDALMEALKVHEALYDGLRRRHGKEWNPEAYVLSTGRGAPLKPSNLSSARTDFCERKDLERLRFHDLRHSVVTDMLMRQHVDVKIVSEFLGHANPAITLSLYVHTDEKMRKRAAMRQNRRVTAAVAIAEQNSQVIRKNVIPLRRAVG